MTSADQADVCGTGLSLTGTGTGLVSFSGGSLAPDSSCTIAVTVAVPAAALPGAYTNTTSNVTATIDIADPMSSNPVTGSPASDDLNVSGFDFSKSFTDDPLIPGGVVDLAFTLENTSATADATAITFTDDLGSVLAGLQPSGALPATPCGAGSTLNFAADTLTLAGGNLLAGTSCVFTVTLDVPAMTATGVYLNTSSALSAQFDGSPIVVPRASDNLEVNKDLLSLGKSFTDDPAGPGDTVTLEFTISNLDAGNAASGIQFDDDLDATLSGLAVSGALPTNPCGAGSTLSTMMPGILELRNGTLAAGGGCTFSVTLAVPGSAVLGSVHTNTSTDVDGLINGLAVRGGAASDDLNIKGVTLSKSFDGPAQASGTALLSFVLQNLSTTDTAIGMSFSDDLDAVIPGLVANGLPQNDVCGAGSVLAGSALLTLNGASLAPEASCTIDVTLQVPAGAAAGTYLNTSSALNANGLPISPPTSASLTIVAPPTFTKAFVPAAIDLNAVSSLEFTIDNSANPVAATAVDFTDNLPAGMLLAMPSNAASTCAGGTLTATPGAATLTYTGGMEAANSNCTLSVDVTAGALGVLNNTSGDLTSSYGNSGTAAASLSVNAPSVDDDGDGVINVIEDGAPNGGDGNSDGVQDFLQSDVTSLPGLNGEYVTLVGTPSIFVNVASAPVPPDMPNDVDFPWGFFTYQISELSTGGVANVQMIVDSGTEPTTLWKFGPEPGQAGAHAYRFLSDGTTGATFPGNFRINIRYVDALRGDSVLTPDNLVIDPVGPANYVNTRIPVLGFWAWFLMTTLMGLAGLYSVARRRD